MCDCSWRGLLLACLLVAFACRAPIATAHPLCLDFTPPLDVFDQTNVTLAFCTQVNSNPDGSCCDMAEDAARKKAFALDLKAAPGPVSAQCQKLHRQVTCGPCEPWAAHLYSDLLPVSAEFGTLACSDRARSNGEATASCSTAEALQTTDILQCCSCACRRSAQWMA
jgi:hypothetical protein